MRNAMSAIRLHGCTAARLHGPPGYPATRLHGLYGYTVTAVAAGCSPAGPSPG